MGEGMQEERIYKWDMVKFILIYLVVLGHVCDYYTSGSNLQINENRIFIYIYLFHMPLFIFISGLFGKRNINEKRYGSIFSFLVLFYIMKLMKTGFDEIVWQCGSFSFFRESGIPWYAFAMFVYYLVTIQMRRFNKKVVFIIAIIISCLAGYVSQINSFLVCSRILVFYPFFFAGYCADAKKLQQILSEKRVRVAAGLFLAVTALIVYKKIDVLYAFRPLLTGQNPYKTLQGYYRYGALFRGMYYVLAFLMSASVISLVPEVKKYNIFVKLGSRTLPIYVFHNLLLSYLIFETPLNEIKDSFFCPLVFEFILALLIVMFTSLKPFAVFVEVIVNFFKQTDKRKSRV